MVFYYPTINKLIIMIIINSPKLPKINRTNARVSQEKRGTLVRLWHWNRNRCCLDSCSQHRLINKKVIVGLPPKALKRAKEAKIQFTCC